MSTDTALARPGEELDGRRRRSLDSRGRVVAALLDLVREGAVAPSAERVAAHARIAAMARRGLEDVVPSVVRDDTAMFEMLDLLLSYETWSRLRQEQGLNVDRACEYLTLAVCRMIGAVHEPDR